MKTALLLLLMGGLSEAAAQASNEQLRAELGAPTTGWLIYSARTPAGDWDLFAARPDGSQTRNLTRTPESSEFYPRLSRDGTQMLYRRVEKNEVISGNRHGEQGVPVLARADGGEPRVLGGVGDLPWASWSPDGRQFVCLAPAGFSIVDALSGKTVRRFPRVGFFQQTTWSPDGRSILGVANSFGSGWSIARIDLATGQASAINRNDCCTPDWSPDGRNIIFSWRVPGQKTNDGQGWTQLWMTDVEGSEPRLLIAEDGRHIYGGCLSPDGRYAIFTGNAGEDGDPSSSGAPMQIMRVADAPLILGKSPAVRSAHPEAGDGPLVTLNPGWEPLWTHHDLFPEPKPPTPEGSIGSETLRSELKSRGWVAFSAPSNNDDWDLYVMRPDGSERRQFTNTPKTQEMGVRFSPDGKRMLYYRAPIGTIVENNNYGTFELVVADLVDSRSHSLGSGHTWASWLPDGKRLACLAVDGIHFIDSMTGRDLGGRFLARDWFNNWSVLRTAGLLREPATDSDRSGTSEPSRSTVDQSLPSRIPLASIAHRIGCPTLDGFFMHMESWVGSPDMPNSGVRDLTARGVNRFMPKNRLIFTAVVPRRTGSIFSLPGAQRIWAAGKTSGSPCP